MCKLCLQHQATRECWALGKGSNCTINWCDEAHHEMLHQALNNRPKAAEPLGSVRCMLLTGHGIDPGSVQPSAQEKAAERDPRCKLLLGLGIDRDTMEVKKRMLEAGDWRNGGSPARAAGGEEQQG